MYFAVTLSQPSDTTVTVPSATSDGTAKGGTKPASGTDYRTNSGTLTFKPTGGADSHPSKQWSRSPCTHRQRATRSRRCTSGCPHRQADMSRTGRARPEPSSTKRLRHRCCDRAERKHSGVHRWPDASRCSRHPQRTTQHHALTLTYTITPGSTTYSKQATGGDYGGPTSGTINFTVGRSGISVTEKTLAIPIGPTPTPTRPRHSRSRSPRRRPARSRRSRTRPPPQRSSEGANSSLGRTPPASARHSPAARQSATLLL